MSNLLGHLPRWAVRLLGLLIAVQVVLTIAYVARDALPGRVQRWFDMDMESNLTTWWSGALLLLVGIAGLCIAASEDRDTGAFWAWVIVGLGFVGLSLEEVAAIHEDVGTTFEASNQGRYWPLLYSPLLILGIWATWRALRTVPSWTRVAGLGSLAILGVGLAAELGSSSDSLRGDLEVVIEENTEYLGAGLLLVLFAVVLTMRWSVERRPRGDSAG